jgi:hypothetical protein
MSKTKTGSSTSGSAAVAEAGIENSLTRRDQLFSAVDEMTRVHNDWVDDVNRKIPDVIYWDTVDALFNAFAVGDMPDECRPLERAVKAFRQQEAIFSNRDDITEGYPGDEFWEARQGTQDAREKTESDCEVRPLESIKDLMALEGMTKEQVCKMYGFVNRKGRTMPHLVDKEMKEPGSVTDKPGQVDGRDWTDPRTTQLKKIKEDTERRHVQALEKKAELRAAEAKPCPETPEELYEQGVSPEQSAKMLKLPLEKVRAMFQDFKRMATGGDSGQGGEGGGAGHNEQGSDGGSAIGNDSGQDDGPIEKTKEQIDTAIIELCREGMSLEDISKDVGQPLRYVKKVIAAAGARTDAAEHGGPPENADE